MAPDPADGGPRDRFGGGIGDEGEQRSLDRALIELTDDDRRDRARVQRRHEQWARQIARETGTLAGVLIELGERGRAVTLTLTGGHHTSGTVVSVAGDVVIVEVGRNTHTGVPMIHLEAVREERSGQPTVGERTAAIRESWRTLLSQLTESGTDVTLRTRSGDQWVGRIQHVGVDLLALQTGTDGSRVSVALDAITDVTWS